MTFTKEYYRRHEVADILCVSPDAVNHLFKGIKKRSNKYFKSDVERMYKQRQAMRNLIIKRMHFGIPEPISEKVRKMIKKEVEEYKKSLLCS